MSVTEQTFRTLHRSTRSTERAERLIQVLRSRREPVYMEELVDVAGPHFLEVHTAMGVLEVLGKVTKFEEMIAPGPHRVAYKWRGR